MHYIYTIKIDPIYIINRHLYKLLKTIITPPICQVILSFNRNMMKYKLFLILIFLIHQVTVTAQHTHETKPSTARSDWGEFEKGELIKTEVIDYKTTLIGEKILKKGELRKGYEYVDKIEVQRMVYESDDLMVTGFVVKPKAKGDYPCIIYNRGGNRDRGSLLVGTAVVYMGKIAASGFIVIASNYRGNSNSEGKEEFGGKDVNDVLNLIPALSQVEGADTSRIGLFGISRGGMMAYMASRNNPQIKAVVVVGGMSNLFTMKRNRPDMESHVYNALIPNYEKETQKQLENRSVVFWADELPKTTKFLFMHGTKDQAVSIEEPRELHEKFIEQRINHVFIEYKKDNHGIRKNSEHASKQINNWFLKYLKNNSIFEETKSRYIVPKK